MLSTPRGKRFVHYGLATELLALLGCTWRQSLQHKLDVHQYMVSRLERLTKSDDESLTRFLFLNLFFLARSFSSSSFLLFTPRPTLPDSHRTPAPQNREGAGYSAQKRDAATTRPLPSPPPQKKRLLLHCTCAAQSLLPPFLLYFPTRKQHTRFSSLPMGRHEEKGGGGRVFRHTLKRETRKERDSNPVICEPGDGPAGGGGGR